MWWKGKKISKRTKKKPWRKRQSRSSRFSFHKYFTTFFYLLLFWITLLYHIFFLEFFFTHEIYPHPHPRPTTSTHYPRPTTFSYTRLRRAGIENWVKDDILRERMSLCLCFCASENQALGVKKDTSKFIALCPCLHLWCFLSIFIYTVEPPCATTSRKRPSPINDRQSKTPKFSQSKPYSWNSSNRPPSVNNCDHFLGLGWWFSLFLTTWNYTFRNLDVACNKLSSIKYRMCPDLFLEEAPCGSILVNDHLP